MELQEALRQIDVIRSQIARTERFEGYRALTVLGTALIGMVAAVAQSLYVSDAMGWPAGYLAIWLGAAVFGVTLTGIELARGCRHPRSSLARAKTIGAVLRFLPSLIAGAMATIAVAMFAMDRFAVLPGLWQLLFGLGVLASVPVLPRIVILAGGFYIFTGIALLVVPPAAALAPWAMGLPFGVGQLMLASMLHAGQRDETIP